MDQEKTQKEELEQAVSNTLEHGEMERTDPSKAAVRRLIPPYEIRVPSKHDPIVEETELYREMAEEVDDRYDKYLARIPKDPERNPHA